LGIENLMDINLTGNPSCAFKRQIVCVYGLRFLWLEPDDNLKTLKILAF